MGVYIGDLWVPFISSFDVDRGNRNVQIIKHIDKTVPPHYAEFPNPILTARLEGTVIQNSGSPKTADDYAEDIVSLLDRRAPYNYIDSFQGRSGWLSVGDVDVPDDAETPLSRDYTITGNFLPSKEYQPRYMSSPSILANTFSIVLGSGVADNYIPLPKGASYTGSFDTITRETSDGSITLVKDNSGAGVPFLVTEEEAGECKVWDTVTGGNTAESTWKRIYNIDHNFTGDCVIENGMMRLKVLLAVSRPLVSVYDGTSWESVTYLTVREAGTASPDANLNRVITLTPDEIKIEVNWEQTTTDETETISILRGIPNFKREQDDHFAHLNEVIQNNQRFAFLEANTIVDALMESNGTKTAASVDNYSVTFNVGSNSWLGLYILNDGDMNAYVSGDYLLSMFTTDESYAITSFTGAIPFDTSNLFKECEDMTQGSGVTYYTGADASPKSGNTGSVLDEGSVNEAVYYQITGGSELPLGTYKMFVRAKDSNQIVNDLTMFVYNETDASLVKAENKTLAASWAYYSMNVTFDDADLGDTITVKLYKNSATANAIDVDYILFVPITSPNGNFPQDIAHQAMVEQNLRRELVGRE